MSERVWHKGPPPHIGWWLTKDRVPSYQNEWRYWNGKEWSILCLEQETGADGSLFGSHFYDPIEWTDYWPENARVPRLDPTGGHWTFNVGAMPDVDHEFLDIAFRSGFCMTKASSVYWSNWSWDIDGEYYDILAWRPAA